MSSICPGSRSIDDFCRRQNTVSPCQIFACLHAPAAHEVDLATEHLAKLSFHVVKVEQSVTSAFVKAHQHIDIAFGSEGFPKNRSKPSQLFDMPSPTKVGHCV